jgi:hypothetical protein
MRKKLHSPVMWGQSVGYLTNWYGYPADTSSEKRFIDKTFESKFFQRKCARKARSGQMET